MRKLVRKLLSTFVFILNSLLIVGIAYSENQNQDIIEELKSLSIEELVNIEVTSVSRKTEKLKEAPAAIYVVTSEDIRRSGLTSIPEILRMVPGLQVAKRDGNKWAITSRGFNDRFSNKLLVLIDGRSVYTPLFSGVYWDVQDTLLEDIDRIEVIRGPGATLWGANAVNGIINIITKPAKETKGGLVTTGIGTEEENFSAIRYGGTISGDTHYRVWLKYLNRDDQEDLSGSDSLDDWDDVFRGGFRLDMERWSNNSFTVQGDIYNGDLGQRIGFRPTHDVIDISGGNILSRWTRNFSDTSDMSVQIYYDRTERRDRRLGEDRDTVDLDIQHSFALFDRHEITWGLGYRYTTDDMEKTNGTTFIPDKRHDNLYSAFLQDDITIIRDSLHMIVGSKYEHNDYTGSEIQPNIRFIWTPDNVHTIWASASRAVRTPSRANHDILIETNIPGVGTMPILQGNEDFDSEEVIAWELGYRVRPTEKFSIDLATFLNEYDDLGTEEDVGNIFAPMNYMDGYTYGLELSMNWQIIDNWRLMGGYTYLQIELDIDSLSNDMSQEKHVEGSSPHNQFHIRSHMDLPYKLQFDTSLYYVDSVPSYDVPSYTRVDSRLAWLPYENLELSVVVQNMFDDRHPEWGTRHLLHTSEIERGFYCQLRWKF